MDRRAPCLHELFERQARKTPDATAVVDAKTTLTYKELDRRAAALAAYLLSARVVPDAAVACTWSAARSMWRRSWPP